MREAEKQFALQGFEGTSAAALAEQAGVSKQNLLYYFPNKLALYKRVLDDVMAAWLQSLDALRTPTCRRKKRSPPILTPR